MNIKKQYLRLFDTERYIRFLELQKHIKDYCDWIENGRPAPPPHIVKQLLIRENAKASGSKILIETGTFKGDMVNAMLGYFTEIYSIELSRDLYSVVCGRFGNNNKVRLFHGDSALTLPQILKGISAPCIFWLDGHYSGGETAKAAIETPIISELSAIAAHQIHEHVILIDDARLFTGTNDYPDMASLSQFFKDFDPRYSLEVHDDVIFVRKGEGPWFHSQNTNFLSMLENSLSAV